jgi:quinol monooxygenase YgiN
MLIVAGHLIVAAEHRDAYLNTCVDVVRQARSAPGCLDYALSADLVDPGRINVFERWQDSETLDAFRSGGASDEQQSMLLGGQVAEYEDGKVRELFG